MKPATQNTAIEISGESRLNKIAPVPFKAFLNQEIMKLYFKNGQKSPDPKDLQLLRNEIYQHLSDVWPGVKCEWITKAFKNGINGEYGEFANISYRAMVHWINEYRDNMKAENFGIKEDPMPSKERAEFVMGGLRNMPNTSNLIKKHKSNRK